METTTARAKAYYVSCIDADRKALVAGPFATHDEAQQAVRAVRAKAYQLDPRSHFYAWGTAGFVGDGDAPQSVFGKSGVSY